MAEITLPIILQILQTTGILVGIFYYITVLRNQQKSQKHAEETRKIQFISEQTQLMREPRSSQKWTQVMDMEWENYEDFMTKYNWENNPDLADAWRNLCRSMNFNGLLIRDGIIDASTYVQYTMDNSPIFWGKFKPIIEEMRVRYDNPELYAGIEILAKETDMYRISKGLNPKGNP